MSMPSDQRTYITVHDGMPEHPKIEVLSDRAFRVLIDLWCWSSRNLSDGFIPSHTWKRRVTSKTEREILHGVAGPLAEAVEGGYQMHDYLEHQRSKAQVEALRAKRAEAGAKGGKARAKALQDLANTQASATASAEQMLKQTGSKPVAESVTETEDRQLQQTKTSSPAPPPTVRASSGAFDDFWQIYPKKIGKEAARRAFTKAVRVAGLEPVMLGAKRYATDENLPERQFIPNPATWLNQGRWDDEPCAKRTPVRPAEIPRPGASVWNKRVGGDE